MTTVVMRFARIGSVGPESSASGSRPTRCMRRAHQRIVLEAFGSPLVVRHIEPVLLKRKNLRCFLFVEVRKRCGLTAFGNINESRVVI